MLLLGLVMVMVMVMSIVCRTTHSPTALLSLLRISAVAAIATSVVSVLLVHRVRLLTSWHPTATSRSHQARVAPDNPLASYLSIGDLACTNARLGNLPEACIIGNHPGTSKTMLRRMLLLMAM